MNADNTDNRAARLLCVVGMTPPVVTETIYGLCIEPRRDDHATIGSITVVTTTAGRDVLERVLIPQLEAMARDYPTAAGRFPTRDEAISIRVPEDVQGEALEDVRTTEDSDDMADCIFETVRRFTEAGEPPLFASLAGGRKTMSFQLGQAMLLFARVSDRLSHVLVSEHAERCRDFFYIPPSPRRMRTGAPGDARGVEFEASEEWIDLHEVKFPRLRQRLTGAVGQGDYQSLLEETQHSLTPALLTVNLFEGTLDINGETLGLTAVEATLYTLLVLRTLVGPSDEPAWLVTAFLCDPPSDLSDLARKVIKKFRPPDSERSAFFLEEHELRDRVSSMRKAITHIRKKFNALLPEVQVPRFDPQPGGRDEPSHRIDARREQLALRGGDALLEEMAALVAEDLA